MSPPAARTRLAPLLALIVVPLLATPSGSISGAAAWNPPPLSLGVGLAVTGTDGDSILDERPAIIAFRGGLLVVWATTANDPSFGARELVGALVGTQDPPRFRTRVLPIAGAADGMLDTDPQLAVFDDQAVLVWSRQAGPADVDVVLATFDGARWSDPMDISGGDAGEDSQPAVAVFRDRLFIAWVSRDRDNGGGSDGEVLVRSSEDLVDWPSARALSDRNAAGVNADPSLAASDGILAAVWSTRENGTTPANGSDIVLRTLDHPTGTWAPAAGVGEPGGPEDEDGAPVVVVVDTAGAVEGAEVGIAWEAPGLPGLRDRQGFPAGRDLLFRWWNSSGQGPMVRVPGDNSTGTDRMAALAPYAGGLAIAWSTDDPAFKGLWDEDIVLRMVGPPPAGGAAPTLGPVIVVTQDDRSLGDGEARAGHDRLPVAAVAAGRLFLAWYTEDLVTGGGGEEGDIAVRSAADPALLPVDAERGTDLKGGRGLVLMLEIAIFTMAAGRRHGAGTRGRGRP